MQWADAGEHNWLLEKYALALTDAATCLGSTAIPELHAWTLHMHFRLELLSTQVALQLLEEHNVLGVTAGTCWA